MKIALFVPDGIGIRNYLYSRVLEQLAGHELHLLHHLPPQVMAESGVLIQPGLTEHILPPLPEGRWCGTLRKICMYGRLHLNARISGNASIKDNWFFFSLVKGKQRTIFRIINALGSIVGSNAGLLQKADALQFNWSKRSESGRKAAEILAEINPDLIFCTHQRSIEAGYVMAAARQLGIRTQTVIFSWDNLPKSRINFLADEYLVWSEWMKQDFLRFYPEVPLARVRITGTPQFEHYPNPALIWPEERFRTYFGLPESRPVVCFSGNEPSFPSDHLYLKDLLEDLELQTTPNKPIILVRPSPNDHTSRFAEIVNRFPNLAVLAKPVWKSLDKGNWETNYPTREDGLVLLNLVHHCKAVVNVGSTMGLDFAHKNKPALYIRYNHPECAWFNLKYGYEQEHFKSLNGLDAVVWIDERAAFAQKLGEVLARPHDFATQRLDWRKLITDDIPDASARIARAMIEPAL